MALSVPICKNFQSNGVKWRSYKPWTKFFYILIGFFLSFLHRYPFTWLNMRPDNTDQIYTSGITAPTRRTPRSRRTCGQPCLKAKMAPVCKKAWWSHENHLGPTSTYFFYSFLILLYIKKFQGKCVVFLLSFLVTLFP